MKLFRSLAQAKGDPFFSNGCVLTIGNFDGVHLGHQAVLADLKKMGDSLGLPTCILTFRPHPSEVLRPKGQSWLLMTYDEKIEALAALGIDAVVEQPFGESFFQISAYEFFHQTVLKDLQVKGLQVGHDFCFGRNREGNFTKLSEWSADAHVPCERHTALTMDGTLISSSKIRESLEQGRISEANTWLGREFFYRNYVIQGDQRGRKIGFPTANMRITDKLLIPLGVYVTRTLRQKGNVAIEYPSVTNIGMRPTFQGGSEPGVVVETHLIQPSNDMNFLELYGEKLEVRFLAKIRDEQKFASIDALKQQIGTDREYARNYLPH